MNLFEAKAIYDSKSGKFIEEFYINGNSVDCDEYYFYLEREKEVEDKKSILVKNIEKSDKNPYEYTEDVNTTDCQCETCNDYDNCCESGECCGECEEDEYECIEEFDYNNLLDIFVSRIQETEGNSYKIRKILDEFADIFIEDYEEDEIEDKCDDCEENKCLGCSECIDCNEECENYISSEEIEELKLIAYFTEEVLKRDNCPQCIFNLIGDIYIKGKEIGWENHKNYIQMCNDE